MKFLCIFVVVLSVCVFPAIVHANFWSRKGDERLVKGLLFRGGNPKELPSAFFNEVAKKSQCYLARINFARLCQDTSAEGRMELASYLTNCHLEAASISGYHWHPRKKLQHARKEFVSLVIEFVPFIADICFKAEQTTGLTYLNVNVENEKKLFEWIDRLLKNTERIKVETQTTRKEKQEQAEFLQSMAKRTQLLEQMIQKAYDITGEIGRQHSLISSIAENMSLILADNHANRKNTFEREAKLNMLLDEIKKLKVGIRDEGTRTQARILRELELQQHSSDTTFVQRISSMLRVKPWTNALLFDIMMVIWRCGQATKLFITIPLRLASWLNTYSRVFENKMLEHLVIIVNMILAVLSLLLLYMFSMLLTNVIFYIGKIFRMVFGINRNSRNSLTESDKLTILNESHSNNKAVFDSLSTHISLFLERQKNTEFTLQTIEQRLREMHNILTEFDRDKCPNSDVVHITSAPNPENSITSNEESSNHPRVLRSSNRDKPKHRTSKEKPMASKMKLRGENSNSVVRKERKAVHSAHESEVAVTGKHSDSASCLSHDPCSKHTTRSGNEPLTSKKREDWTTQKFVYTKKEGKS